MGLVLGLGLRGAINGVRVRGLGLELDKFSDATVDFMVRISYRIEFRVGVMVMVMVRVRVRVNTPAFARRPTKT